jgi:CubicO group peptidase (beta-lactamase class C family)
MRRALLLLACLAPAFAAGPDGMNPERLARIPKRMQEFVDAGKTAGIVTLVARHGHVALLNAVGYRDLETRAPMRADTLFRIMSLTKPMTGAAVMLLVDEGRLAIIDPVEKYLPEFKGQSKHPITVEQVLDHTSAIQEPPGRARTLSEAVAAYAKLPLDFEPGTTWRYRTAGINVAGRIVEAVSGQAYEQFLAERILTPLGMRDTTFFPTDAARVASVYTYKEGKLVKVDKPLPNRAESFAEPGAGAFSTAADLARFYQMVLNGGTLDGRRILSPYAVQLMTSSHTGDLPAGFAPGHGYGLGWGVVRDAKGTFRYSSIGSYGHGGAYRTYGWVDPAKDMICIILLQRTNEGGDVADEINAFLAMSAAAIER